MSIEHLLGKIHNCDCLPFMKQLPDKCVNLVLTDPPYGINSHNKNATRSKMAIAKDYGKCEWDAKIPDKEIFEQMVRISKFQIFWGGNYFSSFLPNSSCWLVWDKLNGDNDFADCELAWTNFKSAVRKFSFMWAGMLQGDMKNKQERVHPTQKPIQLMRWCLEKQDGIVFDPFMGSGTTAVACERLGRKWFGCELEPKYCEIANKRIEAERAQLKLF